MKLHVRRIQKRNGCRVVFRFTWKAYQKEEESRPKGGGEQTERTRRADQKGGDQTKKIDRCGKNRCGKNRCGIYRNGFLLQRFLPQRVR